MAFLDATLLNDLQVSEATNEKRFSELGVIDMVADSTPFVDYILPSTQEAMKELSSLRNADIPVIKDQQVVVKTVAGFNEIPANLPEADKYNFVAYDVFSGFRHYPAAYANNQMDAEFAVNQVMLNVLYGMANSIESVLIARMEERKTQTLGFTTQVSQGDGTYVFDAGTDTLNIQKAAQKETMYHSLEALMGANELPGRYRVATNRAGLTVQRAEALKFANGNEKNLDALGFYDADRLYETGNIAPGPNIFNGWLMRDGAMGMIPNHPYDFRSRTEVDGSVWSVSDVALPFINMQANVYTNAKPSEGTSLIAAGNDSNLVMSHYEEMAIWARFYVVYRYNSDLATRPQDIVKLSGLTT